MSQTRSVVLAFDSFKGSLTSGQACRAAAEGVRRAGATPVECPLSDGGEGFVESLCSVAGGSVETFSVTGPLGEPVAAHVGLMPDDRTAIVETAQACGLGLVPDTLRSPMRTTSRGLGEILRRLAGRARRVIVGLGGSATNDCGIGMLAALEWRFLDPAGNELPAIGASLDRVTRIEPGLRLAELQIVAACDVDNPLFGPRGAALVYGPQKGASAEEAQVLDRGLRRVAELIAPAEASRPGAGAAGGLGFALSACLGGQIASGAELAIELASLQDRLKNAAMCLTGEGRTDSQTLSGKLPNAVANACRRAGVPCHCVSGALGPGWEGMLDVGCKSVLALRKDGEDAGRAFAEAGERLANAAESLTKANVFEGGSR
jgi:glycerate kinase